MSDPDLLNQAAQTQTPAVDVTVDTPQTTTATADPYQDMVRGIVTTDGRQKYATVSDALNSLQPKDEHILRIEAENADLRERLDTAATAQDIANQIATSTPPQQQTVATEGLTEAQAQELVDQRLQHLKLSDTKQANRDNFNSTLQGVYGDKTVEVFTSALQSSGLTRESLANLAEQSPAAAIKVLGLEKEVKTAPVNTSTTSPGTVPSAPTLTPTTRPRAGSTMAAMRAELLKELNLNG